ncbi:MAG: AAA family ATPase [Holosporaceae bacterium]|jgi:DNA polymerase III delta prime subunit|nr:AAA family ATPase [Holosporaceae bacterium]
MALTLLGHGKNETLLAHHIVADKIFPTWIFKGPFGVGKASLAYKFAKRLLSDVAPADDLQINYDDHVGKLVDLRIHPDFFVLEQDDASIDDVRHLLARVRKTPALSKRRVVILENFSNLNRNIYNSLLKILEEPPEHAVFILICTNIGMIPKTLLSRAAKINFNPIDNSLVKKVLENMKIENAEDLARLSNGSVGYALYLCANDGIDIYNGILQNFSDGNYKKALKNIITNNLCSNFMIIKESILRILKIYADILNNVDDESCEREKLILQRNINLDNVCVEKEIKKISELISLINKTESMMLDKNAVVMCVFETFFANFAKAAS